MNIGLPLEDEFSIICGWLGQCNLIHKLDQQQYPVSSKNKFQVPDLLANFTIKGGGQHTVLIEVKSSEKNVLSFRPDYMSKLKAYGNLLGLPVLIAWRKFGIWCLVSIDEFSKKNKNYNLNFNNAIKSSLMGKIAGDFSYTLSVNAGVHIRAKKVKLINSVETGSGTQESWHTVIDDVYFTDKENNEIRNLSPIAQKVFFSWDLKSRETHTEKHIIMHNVVEEQSSLFAHMALTKLLAFHGRDENKVHWRKHLGDNVAISSFLDYRKGIEENLKAGVVYYIFDIEPVNNPKFLKKI